MADDADNAIRVLRLERELKATQAEIRLLGDQLETMHFVLVEVSERLRRGHIGDKPANPPPDDGN